MSNIDLELGYTFERQLLIEWLVDNQDKIPVSSQLVVMNYLSYSFGKARERIVERAKTQDNCMAPQPKEVQQQEVKVLDQKETIRLVKISTDALFKSAKNLEAVTTLLEAIFKDTDKCYSYHHGDLTNNPIPKDLPNMPDKPSK